LEQDALQRGQGGLNSLLTPTSTAARARVLRQTKGGKTASSRGTGRKSAARRRLRLRLPRQPYSGRQPRGVFQGPDSKVMQTLVKISDVDTAADKWLNQAEAEVMGKTATREADQATAVNGAVFADRRPVRSSSRRSNSTASASRR